MALFAAFDDGTLFTAACLSVYPSISRINDDPPTSQTDTRTDGQTTCDSKTALCTVVHRAVVIMKMKMELFKPVLEA